MKYTPDFSSRFRILKGGKISLVVSALLISSSIVGNNAYAANFDIANASLAANLAGSGDTVTTTENIIGNTPVSIAANTFAADISINHNVSITDAGADDALQLIALGNAVTPSTITIASGKTVGLTETNGLFGYALDFMNGVANTTITNSGTISTSITNVNQTGNAAYVASLMFDGDSDHVTITNTGTINTSLTDPVLNSYSGQASGIEFYSHTNAVMKDISITNSGTISTTVANSYDSPNSAGGNSGFGIKMDAYSTSNDIDASNISITNSGTLSVITTNGTNRYADATGIDILVSTDYENTNNYYNATINNMSISNTGSMIVSSVGTGNATGINIKTDSYYGQNSVLNSTITNAGTITVNGAWKAYGIKIDSSDINNLTLTNNATKSISVNGYLYAYGIDLTDITDSTITNAGSISTTVTSNDDWRSKAIQTGDLYGTSVILNSGTITASAEDVMSSAWGIRTGRLNDTSKIENTLTITAIAGGNSYGIESSGVVDSARILNSGTISVTSQGKFAYGSSAIGINISGDVDGEINNSHAITVNALDGGAGKYGGVAATGIHIDYNLEGQINNSGTITVTAAQNTDAYYNLEATGIRVGSYMRNGGTITNSSTGTITVTHNDADGTATGISLYNMEDTSSISNAGSISVQAGSDAFGIKFDNGMYGTSSIANNGTISVNTLNGTAKAISMGYADSTTTITNSGTITATKNNVADYDAFSFVSLNGSGTFNNTFTNSTHYGKLYGNINAPYSTVNNAGLISLPYNANLDATAAQVGTFINNSTGKLEIGLLTDGTTTTHSQLVANDVTFQNGSTIKVNVLAASTNVALLAGTTLNDVVIANNALTVNGTLNVTDNSALLNFSYVIDGNTIDLVEGASTSIVESTLSGGGAGNAQSAAGALQTIQDGGVPAAMQDYYAALGTLSTDTQVAHAVASTTPQATTAATGANTQIMNGIQGIVEMRQNSVMGNGGMNSGDIALRDQNLWIKPFGSKGTQDNKDGVNGFDVKAYGFGLGYDAEISPKQRLGAAFFYTDATVDVNGMPQKSNVDVYTTLVYGNVPVNTNTDFLYQAGYSWQKTKSERTVLPTYDHAKADYTSTTASLDLKLMQNYKIDNALCIRPLVETTYRYNKTPSYSESGAGAMNLSVEKFTSTQLIAGAGAIVDYKLDKESKLVTELHLGYDFHHDAQSVTASYAGAAGVTFDTNGIDNGGWQYNAGVGYEMSNMLGGELNFMYNYQGQGNSFENHTLSAKYIWKF